ncbi:putative membrane protein [Emiliania huxleyi virus 164]|nr:putative membrane protein [Emiliania huxleyi virus 164]
MEASPTVTVVVLLSAILLGVILALLQPADRVRIYRMKQHRQKFADTHNNTRSMWGNASRVQKMMHQEMYERDKLLTNYMWNSMKLGRLMKKSKQC